MNCNEKCSCKTKKLEGLCIVDQALEQNLCHVLLQPGRRIVRLILMFRLVCILVLISLCFVSHLIIAFHRHCRPIVRCWARAFDFFVMMRLLVDRVVFHAG